MADTADDVLPGFEDVTPSNPVADAPQEAPVAESSPAEETKPVDSSKEQVAAEAEAPKEAKAEKPETDSEAEADDVEAPAEETPEEQQPQSKADERKAQLNKEIRDMVSTRNAIRRSVEQANSQAYRAATEDELVEQGVDPLEARVEALSQDREIEKFNNQVAENQLVLETQSQNVLKDFDIFNPDSPNYKAEIAENTAQILQDNLLFDPRTGQVIGSNIEPYTLYQTVFNAYQASAQENQIKGQKAAEKMLASTDAPSSSGPPAEKDDPFLKGFDNPWAAK